MERSIQENQGTTWDASQNETEVLPVEQQFIIHCMFNVWMSAASPATCRNLKCFMVSSHIVKMCHPPLPTRLPSSFLDWLMAEQAPFQLENDNDVPGSQNDW